MVPLADMLSNTVGIVLFILIFTVLATGGAVVPKRLPMEHATDAAPIFFVCTENRLLSLDVTGLEKQFIDPLPKVKQMTREDIDAWVSRYNRREIEDRYFRVEGKAEPQIFDGGRQFALELSVTFVPKEGAGETIEEFEQDASVFSQVLAGNEPKQRFVFFFVRPDGIEVHAAAREWAMKRAFSTGWKPLSVEDRIAFTLTGGGKSAKPQ